MRIVLLSEFFFRGMGYLENVLPKYLARLGADVHVVATDLPFDYRRQPANRAYGRFSDRLRPGSVDVIDGYTVHILGHKQILGFMRMVGLRKKLGSLRPDIVQTLAPIGWIPLDAAVYKPFLGYKLFTGCHHHASVFPLAGKKSRPFSFERLQCTLTRALPGRLVSLLTERCYAITSDCAEIAVRFFGVPPNEVEICPLGVDTEIFYPASGNKYLDARSQLRQRLGFADSEIICIYTGRFDEDKNPELLAKAVEQLSRAGLPFRGLFIGNGAQAESIASRVGCRTHPFVSFDMLGDFYRAANIGVWPTQESMSMLDAAACGLPIIANDTMSAPERIEGNGVAYRLNDLEDLTKVLLGLQDPVKRRRLGSCGAQKIAHSFSWYSIANQRLRDYEVSVSAKRPSNVETVTREIL
jgi:glycosyltransferase involved in cell wall biosynthesis